jgi:hypothetical protein
MKALLTLFVTCLLWVGVAACAGSSHRAAKTAATSALQEKVSTTVDEAHSNGLYDGDDGPTLDYGHRADAADRDAITNLVRRYFAAAATDNGAKACSLLNSFVAEAVAEDFSDTPSLRGKTCAVVLSKFFRQRHKEILSDSTTLDVLIVNVEGNKALVVMHFATSPLARKIAERREDGKWKILDLLDTPLP